VFPHESVSSNLWFLDSKLKYTTESTIPEQVHCLDPRTPEGLIDLTTLGNLLDLSHCLDHRFYSDDISDAEKAEMDHTRQVFQGFKSVFSKHQHLLFDMRQADPMDTFFNPSLLHFASSLIRYKTRMRTFDGTFSPMELKSAIFLHFEMHHKHLLSSLKEKCQADTSTVEPSLDWTGPAFIIQEHTHIQDDCEDSELPYFSIVNLPYIVI
jgi:hypothetical protein